MSKDKSDGNDDMNNDRLNEVEDNLFYVNFSLEPDPEDYDEEIEREADPNSPLYLYLQESKRMNKVLMFNAFISISLAVAIFVMLAITLLVLIGSGNV